MKTHILYSWINLRGANSLPPPPPYRNNLLEYIITYVINKNFFSKFLKFRGVVTLQPPPPILVPLIPAHVMHCTVM